MNELRALLPYLRPYRRDLRLRHGCWWSSPTSSPRWARDSSSGASTRSAAAAAFQPGPGSPSGCCSAVALVGGVARYGMRELLNSGSRRVETDLRDHLYRHLQRMSAEFYDRYPTGDVMARTTNDLLAVRMVAGPALMYLVDTTIRALLIAPAMVAISPPPHPAGPAPAAGAAGGHDLARPADPPPVPGHPGAVQRAHQPRAREPLRRAGGPRLPAGARRRSPASARLSDDYLARNLSLARVQGLFFPLLTLLGGLSALVVLYVGGRLVMAGTGDGRRVRGVRRVPRRCWSGR